jgi:iron uptake system component EfeO
MPPTRRTGVPLTAVLGSVLAVLLAAVACGGSTAGSGVHAATVTATDTECQVSPTTLPAGRHSLSVTNKGNKTTEVYVYGAGDSIAGEAEDIGPGTTHSLSVKLSAGSSYQVACKPGQTGNGIRTSITVTG